MEAILGSSGKYSEVKRSVTFPSNSILMVVISFSTRFYQSTLVPFGGIFVPIYSSELVATYFDQNSLFVFIISSSVETWPLIPSKTKFAEIPMSISKDFINEYDSDSIETYLWANAPNTVFEL